MFWPFSATSLAGGEFFYGFLRSRLGVQPRAPIRAPTVREGLRRAPDQPVRVLVAPAIQLTVPLLKRLGSQLIRQVDHGNRPLRVGHADLLVDERVVEAGGGSFLVGCRRRLRSEEHT